MRTNNSNSYSYLFHSGGFPAVWNIETAFSMAGVATWAFDGITAKDNGSWFLCHIKNDKVVNSSLYLQTEYKEKIANSAKIHISNNLGVIDMLDGHFELVEKALLKALTECGFLISQEQYERDYPEKVLIQDNFNEFWADADAADARGEKLKFDIKYSLWMRPSDGGARDEDYTRADQIKYFRSVAAARGIDQAIIDATWPEGE
jgi:hypothetical protein